MATKTIATASSVAPKSDRKQRLRESRSYTFVAPERPDAKGRFAVQLMLGRRVIVAGEVCPLRPREVNAFVARAFAEAKGLTATLTEAGLRRRLLQLAAPRSGRAETSVSPYAEIDGGLVMNRTSGRNPGADRLTNFTCRIVGIETVDDGAAVELAYELEAKVNGETRRFRVHASQFAGLGWVTGQLGPSAIVYPGKAEHARVAIQTLSGNPPSRTAFAQTGWQRFDDAPVYLHAGGGIGAGGSVGDVKVSLPEPLGRYALPDPPNDLGTAAVDVRACLRLLSVAPATVSLPLLAAVCRAVLGPLDGSIHLAGRSGVRKSELAALAQRFYGPGMGRENLPAAWSATAPALELLAFAAADTLLVIDEYVPGDEGTRQLNEKVARLFRAAGNRAARHRMAGDRLAEGRPPRGLILSTGEDVPPGESIRARMLVVEVGPGDVDLDALTTCQTDAAASTYARATAGYVRWLASPEADGGWRVWRVRREMEGRVARWRGWFDRALQEAGVKTHARTPGLAAELLVGLLCYLEYAESVGAVDCVEWRVLALEARAALLRLARAQARQQADEDPARRFLHLLGAAVAGGGAHLSGPDGFPPADPLAHGWRPAGPSDPAAAGAWVALGPRVGWADGNEVYLDPSAAYSAVMTAAGGGRLKMSSQALGKRLDDSALLVREGGRDELKVRRTLGGTQRRVWQLRPGTFAAG